MTQLFAEVALALPKRQCFDYCLPEGVDNLDPGIRVRVPYAHGERIGVIVKIKDSSRWQADKLKRILEVLDSEPLFNEDLLKLLFWAASYYCHSLGDVLFTALPARLRKGEANQKPLQRIWRVNPELLAVVDGDIEDTAIGNELSYKQIGKNEINIKAQAIQESLKRATKQLALFNLLLRGEKTETYILEQFSKAIIKALHGQELISFSDVEITSSPDWSSDLAVATKPFASTEQALAISAINSHKGFCPFLLEGVTGSGKTEVYLQVIENQLLCQRQVLILVPEISLTPQTLERFEKRFPIEIGIWHSGLTDNERLSVWQKARSGELGIIIGTRSAVFLPLKWPGMIVIDEEHDSSFKQQDGFRYHARDLAIMRAKQSDIPLVMGSATPSLESLNNGLTSRYRHLQLRDKVISGSKVMHQLLDVRQQYLESGLSNYLIERIHYHLRQQQQVMIFINRRGYAPAIVCEQCGFVESCTSCDKPYTYHKITQQLHCHHCGSVKRLTAQCQQCGSQSRETSGVGTEQLEEVIRGLFPGNSVARIDSDTMRSKKALNQVLTDIHSQKHQILVGTQILAKGHHFPNLSLVAILDVDAALFSADFRATEQLAQLITQVSGRTGRAGSVGEMWLQTYHPDHSILLDLLHNGYGHFARTTLRERRSANLPPFEYQVLLRVEAIKQADCHYFLQEVAKMFHMEQSLNEPALRVIGPFPALMEKRQGRFRMQLLLSHIQRLPLHRALNKYLKQIESQGSSKKVRWSVDVDPIDFN